MTKLIFVILIKVIILSACTNSKTASQTSQKSYIGERIVAWNEDTIVTCQFALRRDYKFAYLISALDTNGKVTQTTYKGTVKLLDDKIFLLYHQNIRPANVQSFLIKEVSGDYLIQDFTDGRKRMYLRIAYPSRWHFR